MAVDLSKAKQAIGNALDAIAQDVADTGTTGLGDVSLKTTRGISGVVDVPIGGLYQPGAYDVVGPPLIPDGRPTILNVEQNGEVVARLVDSDGDGQIDMLVEEGTNGSINTLMDTDGDGLFDQRVVRTTNADGTESVLVEIDANEDGTVDQTLYDPNTATDHRIGEVYIDENDIVHTHSAYNEVGWKNPEYEEHESLWQSVMGSLPEYDFNSQNPPLPEPITNSEVEDAEARAEAAQLEAAKARAEADENPTPENKAKADKAESLSLAATAALAVLTGTVAGATILVAGSPEAAAAATAAGNRIVPGRTTTKGKVPEKEVTPGGRMVKARGTVTDADVANKGSEVNLKPNKKTNFRNNGYSVKGDSMGHIQGNQLGGTGSNTTDNFFGQNIQVNGGEFADFENTFAAKVKANPGHVWNYEQEYFYEGATHYDPTIPNRPGMVRYSYQDPTTGEIVSEVFENPLPGNPRVGAGATTGEAAIGGEAAAGGEATAGGASTSSGAAGAVAPGIGAVGTSGSEEEGANEYITIDNPIFDAADVITTIFDADDKGPNPLDDIVPVPITFGNPIFDAADVITTFDPVVNGPDDIHGGHPFIGDGSPFGVVPTDVSVGGDGVSVEGPGGTDVSVGGDGVSVEGPGGVGISVDEDGVDVDLPDGNPVTGDLIPGVPFI